MQKVMMLTTTAYMSERFNRNNIVLLEELGYEVHVVANFDEGNPTTKEVLEEFKTWVEKHKGKCYSIPITAKPWDIYNFMRAYFQCIDLIKRNKYEFIHCHTPMAGVLGRILSFNTNTKNIYTAHGFHFFKGAPIINWLLYYPVEKFCSLFTDLLITINKEDYEFAKKKMKAKTVEYIPGVGINLNKLTDYTVDVKAKKNELGLNDEDIFILSVGELSKRKNHKIVIEAIAKLHNKNIHYVIAGQGKMQHFLLEFASSLNVNLHLLGYRTDTFELLKIADIFVMPSRQEGLSVALMEAMASGLPCVVSKIRGNVDLIQDEQGGYLCDSRSSDEFCVALEKLIDNQAKMDSMGKYNQNVIARFDQKFVDNEMKMIYQNM